jgi:hypothetical protein
MSKKEQIKEMAADIYSMLRSDAMSRAMASMLHGEGYQKVKWIPVEERLPDPKEHDWVLGAVMTTECSEGNNYYLPPHIVECRNGEWWGMNVDVPLKLLRLKVTHWMPLPELPKGV